MATQLKKYVNPAGGADTYISLSACLAANVQNLVQNDLFFDIEIDGDWSGGADTVSGASTNGYITDETHYVNIYTTAAARHPGYPDVTKYLLAPGFAQIPIFTQTSCIELTGLQITANSTQGNSDSNALNKWIKVSKCIIQQPSATHYCLNQYYSQYCSWYVWDNIFIGAYVGVREDNYASSPCYCWNNTFQSCGTGITGAASPWFLSNNIFVDCGRDISIATPKIDTFNSTTNDNTKGLSASGLGNRFSQTFSFTDKANHNLTLLSNDTGAKGYGIDLSGISNGLFTDDITGNTRGNLWDIGASQVTSGGSQAFFKFIGKAAGYTNVTGTQIDCSTTLDIQAGDLLVALVWASASTTVSVADSVSGNSFTMNAVRSAGSIYGCMGYVLSAAAKTGSTIRMTTGTSVSFREISVLQFRPVSGKTVTVDTYDDNASGSSANILSTSINTSGADELVVVGALGDYGGMDGATAYTKISDILSDYRFNRTNEDGMWFKQYLASASGVHGEQVAYNQNWLCHIIAFKAVVSGGDTTKSVTDSGSGSDAVAQLLASLALTDTGHGADGFGGGLAAQVPLSESGIGSDVIAQLLASLALTDSGHGVDALAQLLASLTLTDSGHGVDGFGAGIAAQVPLNESGIGADVIQSILASLSVSDTGQGIDAAQALILVAITDSGSGADVLYQVLVSAAVSDAAQGADGTPQIAVLVSLIDAGQGQETPQILANVTIPDTGSGVDTIDIMQAVLKLIADSGSGSDAISSIAVVVPVTDEGSGMDLMGMVNAMLQVIDAGRGTEIIITTSDTRLIAEIKFKGKPFPVRFTGGENIKFTGKKFPRFKGEDA